MYLALIAVFLPAIRMPTLYKSQLTLSSQLLLQPLQEF